MSFLNMKSNDEISDLFKLAILNDLIFEKLKDYIDDNNSICSLLNTLKTFEGLKKLKFYWNINLTYSKKYYVGGDFKLKLDSIIDESWKQLSLNLSYCDEISDVSALGHVNSLNLSECRNVIDVSDLGSLHFLNLSHCNNVSDVSALGNVHSLDLSGSYNVDDVSNLRNVNPLNLSCCIKLIGVSALGNVH